MIKFEIGFLYPSFGEGVVRGVGLVGARGNSLVIVSKSEHQVCGVNFVGHPDNTITITSQDGFFKEVEVINARS